MCAHGAREALLGGRSASPLDDCRPMRVLLFFVLPLALVVAAVTDWRFQFQITRRLRSNHVPTWESLGCPTPFRLWLAPIWYWVGAPRSYFWWLLQGRYEALEDSELTALGRKQNALFFISCCLLLAWPICAWFAGYLRAR